MYKTILVSLAGGKSDAAAMNTAALAGRPFGASLDCLFVRESPQALVAGTASATEPGLGMGVYPAEFWNLLIDLDKKRARAAHDAYDAFCRQQGVVIADTVQANGKVSASWREVEDEPLGRISSEARFHDLVVIARATLSGDRVWDAAGDVLIRSGKPVLLAPSHAPQMLSETIAIAWKETPEAARAVTAALPLLATAKEIVVLAAAEDDDETFSRESAERLAGMLRLHGFSVRATAVKTNRHRAGEAIVAAALDAKAGLLVMGAYSHNRMRELIFGGVTQHVLGDDRIAALLAH